MVRNRLYWGKVARKFSAESNIYTINSFKYSLLTFWFWETSTVTALKSLTLGNFLFLVEGNRDILAPVLFAFIML